VNKCNVAEFSLAYNTEHGQGSAWVKVVLLGFLKKALGQAGYTARTASSSLGDESYNNLKGDLLFHSSSAGVFLAHTAIPPRYASLCRWLCETAHTALHRTAQY